MFSRYSGGVVASQRGFGAALRTAFKKVYEQEPAITYAALFIRFAAVTFRRVEWTRCSEGRATLAVATNRRRAAAVFKPARRLTDGMVAWRKACPLNSRRTFVGRITRPRENQRPAGSDARGADRCLNRFAVMMRTGR